MGIEQDFADLDRLNAAEAQIGEMHDRVCGRGMYIVEGQGALGELGHDIRSSLHLKIGQSVVAMREGGTLPLWVEPKPAHVMRGFMTNAIEVENSMTDPVPVPTIVLKQEDLTDFEEDYLAAPRND